ncbi:MAG TPA: class I SAM-dependent methyltransferase [Gaiellaceae bacterium]|nr:class I SAM-dependent methyltransferase [Gaiellaceae bacterium]
MTVLVLDGSLLGDALAQAGDEDVIVVDHSAAELARLERAAPDPRVFYLIGDPEVLPLPDRLVDRAVGGGSSPEIARVLRA